MKFRLYQQKLPDEYFANLAKMFDDNVFYVYFIDKEIFKFTIRIRFPKLDDFIHGPRYLTIGKGSLSLVAKDNFYFLISKTRLHILFYVLFFILLLPLVGSLVVGEFVAFFGAFIFASPFIFGWLLMKYICYNKIKLLCKTFP